jgi:hypothetical protein
MGASGFFGNGLFDRLNLFGMQAERRPAYEFLKFAPFSQVVKYTLIQLTAVLVIFLVSFNFFLPEGSPSVAIAFPLLIAILIPIRERCMPTQFAAAELLHLDPPPKVDEDLVDVSVKTAETDRTKPLVTVPGAKEPNSDTARVHPTADTEDPIADLAMATLESPRKKTSAATASSML